MSTKKTLRLVRGSEEWKRLRERARTSLYFLNAKVLNHEGVVPMTLRAHYALCRFAEGKTGIPEIDNSRVRLIQVGRGWGKSTLVTKALPIYRLINDPNYSIGIANENQTMAEGFLSMVKSELETNQLLNHLFPELMTPATDAAPVWKVSRIIIPGRTRPNPVNPSVLAAGAGTTITGVHLNEWIVDDIISDDAAENARTGSFTEIDKTNRWIIRLQPLLSNPKQDPITFIGTPWWPGDCYDFIEETFGRGEDDRIFIWQLRLPDGEVQEVKLIQKGELAIFRFPAIQDGRAVFPERFDLDTLDSLRRDSPAFFSAQYLLNPTTGERLTFREEYLKEFEWEGQYQIRYRDEEGQVRYERIRDMQILISVDPAISSRASSARSAIVVIASNGRYLFLLDVWAERASPSEVATKVVELFKQYRPTRIIIEAVAYQMALAEIIEIIAREQSLRNLPIYEYRSGADRRGKMRIAGLEPYFRKGLFYIHRQSAAPFLEEYLNFSPDIGARTVDVLDAIAFQKESWEVLGMLGDDPEARGLKKSEWRQRVKRKADKVRARFGRKVTREWSR